MTIQLIIDFGDVTLAFDDYQKNNGFKIGSFYMFIGVNKRKN